MYRQLGYQPRPGKQTEIHQSEALRRVIDAGRRWGKSLVASKEAVPAILTTDTLGYIVSTTHDLTYKVFKEVYKDLIVKAQLGAYLKRKSLSAPYFLVFDFPWGEGLSEVYCKSAENPNNLVGDKLDWIVFDEAAQSHLRIWEQYLEPALADRDGWALFISTPRGYNWFYDLYKRGKDPNDTDWESWKAPTSDNPIISKKFLARARHSNDDASYRQEYEADFTISTGQVYPGFTEELHVVPHQEMKIPAEWPRYRMIDWGFSPDPFVMLWAAIDGEDRIYIYHEYIHRRRSLPKHANYLVRQVRKRNKDAKMIKVDGAWRVLSRNKHIPPFDTEKTEYVWTVADPHGAGRSNMATMQEHGIPCWGMSTRIEAGLDKVRERLAVRDDGTTGVYVSSACVETISEFNLYAYPESESKNVGDNPIDYNNHCMDCVRYFVMALETGGYTLVKPRLG